MGFDNYFYPSNMIASESYFGLSGPLGLKKFMLDFYPSHLGQIKFYSHLYPSNIKPSHNHLGQVGFFTLPNMMAKEQNRNGQVATAHQNTEKTEKLFLASPTCGNQVT